MSFNCPICYKKGKKILDTVKNNYPVNFYSCGPCDIHFSELYDKPEKVLDYSAGTDYVFANTKRDPKKCKFDEYSFRLKKIEKIKNKKNILDIGCADGKILSQLKKQKYNVYGIEINKEHIKNLKNKRIKFYDKDILTF